MAQDTEPRVELPDLNAEPVDPLVRGLQIGFGASLLFALVTGAHYFIAAPGTPPELPEPEKRMAANPDEVKARHILVRSKVFAEKLMEDIRANKITFADAAKRHSRDPGSKDKGGDLGWNSSDSWVPAFARAAFGAPVGKMVGPVKSSFGYHIIQVEDRRRKQKDKDKDAKIDVVSLVKRLSGSGKEPSTQTIPVKETKEEPEEKSPKSDKTPAPKTGDKPGGDAKPDAKPEPPEPEAEAPKPAAPDVPYGDIDAATSKKLFDANKGNKDFLVLDVRTPGEFKAGHIEGAVLVDVNGADFAKNIEKLDRDRTYLVHCKSGKRSRRSLATLRRLGFKKIYHMQKGMLSWKAAGYPTVK